MKNLFLSLCVSLSAISLPVGCRSDLSAFYLVEMKADGHRTAISREDYARITEEAAAVFTTRGWRVFREMDGKPSEETFTAAIDSTGKPVVNIYAAISSATRISIDWSPRETLVTARGIKGLADQSTDLAVELRVAIRRATPGKDVRLAPRTVWIQN